LVVGPNISISAVPTGLEPNVGFANGFWNYISMQKPKLKVFGLLGLRNIFLPLYIFPALLDNYYLYSILYLRKIKNTIFFLSSFIFKQTNPLITFLFCVAYISGQCKTVVINFSLVY